MKLSGSHGEWDRQLHLGVTCGILTGAEAAPIELRVEASSLCEDDVPQLSVRSCEATLGLWTSTSTRKYQITIRYISHVCQYDEEVKDNQMSG
eukprot:gene25837-biopygen9266